MARNRLRAILVAIVLVASASLAVGDTFVHRQTGEKVTGRLLGTVFKDGEQRFYVKTDDGRNRLLPESEWVRKEDTPASRKENGKEIEGMDKLGGATVNVDFVIKRAGLGK